MSEHDNYQCLICASTWVRYEHEDYKDCTDDCDDPCIMRCCNEEDCIGEAVWINPALKSISIT